jgi:hypothetical protein
MEKPREAFLAIGIAHLAENTQHDKGAAKVGLLHSEDFATEFLRHGWIVARWRPYAPPRVGRLRNGWLNR